MPPIYLLIKPASSSCNLSCRYCFYHEEARQRKTANYGLMSAETSEVIIKKVLSEATEAVTFAFQGGEPAVCGLDFYRRWTDLVKLHNTKGLTIHYGFQTNGLFITPEWAAFFKENHFLLGVSLDGFPKLHNASRTDHMGKGSFDQVMEGIRILNEYEVEYNILCVVTRETTLQVEKLYRFFRKNGMKYLQFIPCIDGADGTLDAYSLSSEQYGDFLKRLFDLWYEDCLQGDGISIRYFDNILSIMSGYPPESCAMNGFCSCQFVIEADGGVYPCDFYVLDDYKIGNADTDSFAAMEASEAAVSFLAPSRNVDEKCSSCRYFILCRGGCRRDREPQPGDGLSLNRFCQAYYDFYEYSLERFRMLIAAL